MKLLTEIIFHSMASYDFFFFKKINYAPYNPAILLYNPKTHKSPCSKGLKLAPQVRCPGHQLQSSYSPLQGSSNTAVLHWGINSTQKCRAISGMLSQAPCYIAVATAGLYKAGCLNKVQEISTYFTEIYCAVHINLPNGEKQL